MKALSVFKQGQLLRNKVHVLLILSLMACFSIVDAQTNYRISMGDDFGAVIDAEGNLFLWGAIVTGDAAGGLQQVPGSWKEVSVSRTPASEAHVLLISSDGKLWAFGKNDRGQLGTGDQTDYSEPVKISNLANRIEACTQITSTPDP